MLSSSICSTHVGIWQPVGFVNKSVTAMVVVAADKVTAARLPYGVSKHGVIGIAGEIF